MGAAVLVLNGRHTSYVSQAADAVIRGAGAHGRAVALAHVSQLPERRRG
jgi:3-dehydroquinate dehydratase